jgi:hypothetical protein
MLPSAILGIGILVGLILIMRWYATADPAAIKRAMKWGAIWGLGLVALFLALTGRLAAAFGLVMGIFAFGWRLFNMYSMFQQARGMFGNLGGFSGRAKAAGQESKVESHYLRMSLDHDSGRMDGEVLDGKFRGRLLSAMPLEDLMEFRQDVASDADSRGLLDAYLDRAHIGWRHDREPDEDNAESSPSPPSGPMTRAEALKILALEPDADRKAIKTAYRSLMAKVHPDRGGSPYLAAKINEAKDLLLKE